MAHALTPYGGGAGPRNGRGVNSSHVYQIDFSAVASGKRIASSKRRIRWRFGFTNLEALGAGESGIACRGEEHDITFVWSITSGKRLILADSREIHYTNSRSNSFEFSWTMRGNHILKIVAHATPPLNASPGFRQYDFFVDGQSFFTFPKVYRLGLSANEAAHIANPLQPPPMAGRSRSYRRLGSTGSGGRGVGAIEAPRNQDEEQLYLQEAIKNSLEDAHKKKDDPPPPPSSSDSVRDLLDFSSDPAPIPIAPTGAEAYPTTNQFAVAPGAQQQAQGYAPPTSQHMVPYQQTGAPASYPGAPSFDGSFPPQNGQGNPVVHHYPGAGQQAPAFATPPDAAAAATFSGNPFGGPDPVPGPVAQAPNPAQFPAPGAGQVPVAGAAPISGQMTPGPAPFPGQVPPPGPYSAQVPQPPAVPGQYPGAAPVPGTVQQAGSFDQQSQDQSAYSGGFAQQPPSANGAPPSQAPAPSDPSVPPTAQSLAEKAFQNLTDFNLDAKKAESQNPFDSAPSLGEMAANRQTSVRNVMSTPAPTPEAAAGALVVSTTQQGNWGGFVQPPANGAGPAPFPAQANPYGAPQQAPPPSYGAGYPPSQTPAYSTPQPYHPATPAYPPAGQYPPQAYGQPQQPQYTPYYQQPQGMAPQQSYGYQQQG